MSLTNYFHVFFALDHDIRAVIDPIMRKCKVFIERTVVIPAISYVTPLVLMKAVLKVASLVSITAAVHRVMMHRSVHEVRALHRLLILIVALGFLTHIDRLGKQALLRVPFVILVVGASGIVVTIGLVLRLWDSFWAIINKGLV